jgi:hypothetical protein
MKPTVGTAVCLVLKSAVAACGSNADHPGLMPASDPGSVTVEAQQDVIVTQTPLGDVVKARGSKRSQLL